MRHGMFDWKKRMGIHLAYHQSATNNLVHKIMTPIQLCGIAYLVTGLLMLAIDTTATVNMAIIALLPLMAFYLVIEPLTGLIVSAILLLSAMSALTIPVAEIWIPTLGIALLASGGVFQAGIGHGVFEKGNINLGNEFQEFKETGSPMVFIFFFFFPILQLFIDMGYRKNLNKQLLKYKDEYLAQITSG